MSFYKRWRGRAGGNDLAGGVGGGLGCTQILVSDYDFIQER